MTRELICGAAVVTRSLEKAGAKPEGDDEAAGNGTGKFESNLSLVSIVDVYPTRYFEGIKE